ncbi:MAG TPA: sigma-70 family RNA polymerase sigma factor, partial [Gammaproteobacteria bacterium]|nr:sigma-70 family RNA polymerase sigma factor [Gammaproteobacteria bacterium]HRP86220.1 sigma-70 family RNA polymerase sigma factor [Gammaproteobacteria bacterium]
DFGHRFYSWIYRIAINESINFLHSRQRYAPLDDVAECVDENDGPPEAYGNAELHRRVQAAMMTLSPEHRAVITLRHFTECSYQDIANVLGIPEKTVKSRLFDARRLLRGQLADDGTGAP